MQDPVFPMGLELNFENHQVDTEIWHGKFVGQLV